MASHRWRRLVNRALDEWPTRLFNHFVLEGYAYDWLLALTLIVVNFTVPVLIIPPFQRAYVEGDPALSYPNTHVPLTENQKFALIFGLPGLIAAIMQIWWTSWLDWHHLMLTVIEGFAIESSFKKWMNLVGRWRPDWLSRKASGDPELIIDGNTSYPSGHAAETFMAFGILSLYLMTKMKLFVRQRPGHFAKAVLGLLPLGLATAIACSRLVAYRHDFSDINAGIIIGLVSGVVAYALNYNSPFSEQCDLPKPRVVGGALLDASSPPGQAEETSSRRTPLL